MQQANYSNQPSQPSQPNQPSQPCQPSQPSQPSQLGQPGHAIGVPARLEMPRYADRAVAMTGHTPYIVAETQGLVRPDEYMVPIDSHGMHQDWATHPMNPMVSLSYLTGRVKQSPARDLRFV